MIFGVFGLIDMKIIMGRTFLSVTTKVLIYLNLTHSFLCYKIILLTCTLMVFIWKNPVLTTIKNIFSCRSKRYSQVKVKPSILSGHIPGYFNRWK